jgi:hypothetical protein
MQFLDSAVVVCKSEHQALRKLESLGQCKSEGTLRHFKRNYAKEQLRENMEQRKSKERGFKE